MRYRVTYRKRFNAQGGESDEPQDALNLPEGVVRDAVFVERFEPDALHTGDTMEEDDDFLAFGSEIWEYEIAKGREKEFEEAVTNSGTALEIQDMENLPEPLST